MNELKTDSTGRELYIDVARGIAIILMVIGHLGIKHNLIQFIYSFHMPLFFVISGLTSKSTDDFRQYIIKRIKRLYVPYLLFALIFCNGKVKSFALVLYGSRNALSVARSSTPLWFLSCLFAADILFQIILKLRGGGYTAQQC